MGGSALWQRAECAAEHRAMVLVLQMSPPSHARGTAMRPADWSTRTALSGFTCNIVVATVHGLLETLECREHRFEMLSTTPCGGATAEPMFHVEQRGTGSRLAKGASTHPARCPVRPDRAPGRKRQGVRLGGRAVGGAPPHRGRPYDRAHFVIRGVAPLRRGSPATQRLARPGGAWRASRESSPRRPGSPRGGFEGKPPRWVVLGALQP